MTSTSYNIYIFIRISSLFPLCYFSIILAIIRCPLSSFPPLISRLYSPLCSSSSHNHPLNPPPFPPDNELMKNKRDCVPLVNLIGLLFQIRDDYLNLSSTQYTQNKGLCEDLTEGKFSFPIIHSIRSDPSNLQLLNILKQRSRDDEVKKYALTYMEGTGSFEYTRKVMKGLMVRARALVEIVDDGENLGGGVREILDKMVFES